MATANGISWQVHREWAEKRVAIRQILEPALNLFRHALDYDAAAIWLLPSEGKLKPVLYGEKQSSEPFYADPPASDLAKAILETGRSVCWGREELSTYTRQSTCCLGRRLKLSDQVSGVLEVHRLGGEPFKEEDMLAADQLAQLAAQALQVARLAEQLAADRERAERERRRLEQELRQQVAQMAAVIEARDGATDELREALNEQAEELSRLQKIGLALNSERDPDQVMTLVVSEAVRLADAENAAIALITDDQIVQFISTAGPLSETLQNVHWPLEDSLTARVLRTGQPIVTEHLSQEPWTEQEWAKEMGITAAILVPLAFNEQVIGTLNVFHTSEQEDFSRGAESTLTILASQAATALANARLYRTMLESQGQLTAALRSMSDGLLAYDPQGQIIFANPPFYQLYGLTTQAQSLEGQSVEHVMRLIQDRLVMPEGFRRLDPDLRQSQQPFLEEEVELKNPIRYLRRRISAIRDLQGRLLGYVEVHQDVTETKRNERLKDDLLALVSHELRTPLMSILGYAQLLQQHPQVSAAKRNRWLDMIITKSRVLNRLIDQILDISRLRANRFVLHIAKTNIAELVQRVVSEMQAANPTYRFHTQLEEVGTLSIDSERVSEALTQVLANAVHYSPEDHNIWVRVTQHTDSEVIISVADHGIGIEPEYAERIFEPFFRVPKPSVMELEGSGLGLSVSRGLLRAHHGRIWFVSQPGQGTTFYIGLPRESEDSEEDEA